MVWPTDSWRTMAKTTIPFKVHISPIPRTRNLESQEAPHERPQESKGSSTLLTKRPKGCIRIGSDVTHDRFFGYAYSHPTTHVSIQSWQLSFGCSPSSLHACALHTLQSPPEKIKISCYRALGSKVPNQRTFNRPGCDLPISTMSPDTLRLSRLEFNGGAYLLKTQTTNK